MACNLIYQVEMMLTEAEYRESMSFWFYSFLPAAAVTV